MSFKCTVCGVKNHAGGNVDLFKCLWCQSIFPTGLEKKIRKVQEAYKNHLPYPKAAAGRAIGYAAAIYELSTHNQGIDHSGIEKRVANKAGASAAATATKTLTMSGRSSGGLTDPRCGLLILQVSGTTGDRVKLPWNMVYVIFRGSRGTIAGETDNPEGAGWGTTSTGEKRNLDWRCNFTSAQVVPSWCASAKVHQGFYEMYGSMRDTVHRVVGQAIAGTPKTQVVVTGHSLGAGLATLCGHDLESSGLCHPFVFPFCCPRSGDLGFVRDYDEKISNKKLVLDSEPDMAAYNRSFVFVQSTDPVSWGGAHGFKNVMSDKSAKQVADSGNTLKQGIYVLKKTKSETMIYYHTGNLYKASWWGVHLYTYMEKVILGK